MLEKRVDKLEQQRGSASNDFKLLDQELDHYQKLMNDFELSGLLPRYRALQLRELPEPELDRFLEHARKARANSLRLDGREPLGLFVDNRTTTDEIFELLTACRRRRATEGGDS